METSEITIEILRNIQAGITGLRHEMSGLREDMNARFAEHGECQRLGERVDRLEVRVDVLEERVEPKT